MDFLKSFFGDVYLRNRSSEDPFAATELGFKAAAFCKIEDLGKIHFLAMSFLVQLREIKDEAIKLRILAWMTVLIASRRTAAVSSQRKLPMLDTQFVGRIPGDLNEIDRSV
jgi:hypothetical protein